jgi:hypothetical protein
MEKRRVRLPLRNAFGEPLIMLLGIREGPARAAKL